MTANPDSRLICTRSEEEELETRIHHHNFLDLEVSLIRSKQMALRVKGQAYIPSLEKIPLPETVEGHPSCNVTNYIQFNMTEAPRAVVRETVTPPKLFWNLEETAARLGLSIRTLFELRHMHPLYAPDGARTARECPKKQVPLWSDALVELIAFARSMTAQGVRQLTDEEGLKVRQTLADGKRQQYLSQVKD